MASAAASHASFLPPLLTFCAAAVVAVPLFRRLGQSAVLGYLAAGVVIGPSVLGLVGDPETTLGVAELGVVLLLFLVGLELKLPQLYAMRRSIFGLGTAQLAVTTVVIAGAAWSAGIATAGAFVIGVSLALSATAVALQTLEERGDLQTPYGERSFAVLLLQDLAIAPILALLPLLGADAIVPGGGSLLEILEPVARVVGAVVLVVVVGRYGLNPFFRLLASGGAREVMTASALLVVLGTALLMEEAGLSMAMGAFMAGLLLAESNFRHQLEADIEPFRGMLLGLFFMSVGMTIDLSLVVANAGLLAAVVPAVVAAKILIVGFLFRLAGLPSREALRAGAALAPAGEFAFVILPLAAAEAILDGATAQLVTAIAALTMLAGPIAAKALDAVMPHGTPEPEPAAEEDFGEAGSRVLVIGFGRFGQTVTQALLAHGEGVTVIERDVAQIRAAARFGFRVYYGDGTRLDVLRAAGAGRARIVCICVDDREAAFKMVELVHDEFPNARTYVRAHDRVHAIELMQCEVDFQLRETFESALAFARAALEELGAGAEGAKRIVDDVRRRDVARLVLQKAEGLAAGRNLLRNRPVTPEPLSTPKEKPRGLSPETRAVIESQDA